METRPCKIAPSLSPEERARFDNTLSDFAHFFVHNTTAQHKLGGKSPHELVYGRVHLMRIYDDRSYPGEGTIFSNPHGTHWVSTSTPARTHSPKSRPPLKRRLKLFAARW